MNIPDCPECGARYRDQRTGLSFRDVFALLWSHDDDPATWRQKSRGVVLGKWHQIKRELWDEHLRSCPPPF